MALSNGFRKCLLSCFAMFRGTPHPPSKQLHAASASEMRSLAIDLEALVSLLHKPL